MAPEHETDELFEGMSKEESIEFQLQQWVEGVPLHNPITDMCCPDFACCAPSHRSLPINLRRAFAQAYRNNNSAITQAILLLGIGISLADLNEVDEHVEADLNDLLQHAESIFPVQ